MFRTKLKPKNHQRIKLHKWQKPQQIIHFEIYLMYIPPILKHYQYGDYLRIDGEERLYVTPTGNLHSVTTILSATDSEEDKKGLENWRRFVGEEKANEIVTEATTVGSLMHENLENLMQGKSYNQG